MTIKKRVKTKVQPIAFLEPKSVTPPLIEGGLGIGGDSTMVMLSIDLITPNDWNPNMMSDSKFKVLQEKITATQRLQQPLLIYHDGNGYRISDGEHRYHAAKAAGMTEVPVVIVPMTTGEAKLETVAMNNLHGEYIPIKMAELLVSLQEEYSEDDIRRLTGITDNEYASLTSLMDIGDFSFETAPVIAQDYKNTPIAIHIALYPEQHKEYIVALESAVELAGGLVTPLYGTQVIEYDKAMKVAFNLAGVQLRNKGLATICAVFNNISKEDMKMLLAKVLANNPDYLED